MIVRENTGRQCAFSTWADVEVKDFGTVVDSGAAQHLQLAGGIAALSHVN